MYKIICLILVCISLCSCASSGLNKFGHKEVIYTKEYLIKDNVQYNTKQPFLEIVRGDGGELCFENTVNPKAGEAITVRANDLQKALDYFYNSKATWNVVRTQKDNENIIRAVANSDVQIRYEVAYCTRKEIKLFKDQEEVYASFRLIKP